MCAILTAVTSAMESGQKQISGEGKIVELDKVKIGKRKYNTGLLDIIEYSVASNVVLLQMFLFYLYQTDVSKLSYHFRQYVAPGSIVYTDKWLAYNTLKNYNYIFIKQ